MSRLLVWVTVLLVAGTISGCAGIDNVPGQVPGYAEAILKVLEQDTRLGTVRNNAPRNAPIAEAVRDYVTGLDALDLNDCPPDFQRALRRHRDAWQASIAFFEQHEELRGELHEVWDDIRARGDEARQNLEQLEADILETWAEVETARDAHIGGQPPG